jgi:NADPH-dependent 2,4-dienoyl-CoA reductase/sulfur reductase-like enzyme
MPTADVAIIGAGPAGIAAAVAAADRGASVVLLDSAPRPGGQIWRHRSAAELPAPAARWLQRLRHSTVTWIPSATVVGVDPARVLLAEREGRGFSVRWRRLIIATGATERFLPFPGWTLPGVLGVGGLQAMLKSGAEVAGRRVILAGSGPLLLPVAAALARAGARVAAVAEQAPAARVYGFAAGLVRTPGRLAQAAAYRSAFLGARYRCGTWVVRIDAAGAGLVVSLTDGRRVWTELADLAGVGYGLVPSVGLAQLAGCAISDGCVVTDRLQRTSVPDISCAGEPTGIAGSDSAIAQGTVAGTAAGTPSRPAQGAPAPRAGTSLASTRGFAARLSRAFALRPELHALADSSTIVCRCEDVRLGRIDRGWTMRQTKLYTRAGMGPCQGRVCGPALEFVTGKPADPPRLPLFSTPVATLAAGPPSSEGDM